MDDLKELLAEATPGPWREDIIPGKPATIWSDLESVCQSSHNNARLIAMAPDLAAEVLRLREAITLIERCYYMEGKDAKWRAAHMNGIARDAQNGDNFAWARRLFPRDNQHLADARAALKGATNE